MVSVHWRKIYSLLLLVEISINSIWSNVSSKATVSMLIFWLVDLSTDINGVLKSSTMVMLLSISPFMSINICFIYLGASTLSVQMFVKVMSSLDSSLYYEMPFFVSSYSPCLKVCFVCPGQVAKLFGALSHTSKCYRFNSQS